MGARRPQLVAQPATSTAYCDTVVGGTEVRCSYADAAFAVYPPTELKAILATSRVTKVDQTTDPACSTCAPPPSLPSPSPSPALPSAA
jgi:hypothetical protein